MFKHLSKWIYLNKMHLLQQKYILFALPGKFNILVLIRRCCTCSISNSSICQSSPLWLSSSSWSEMKQRIARLQSSSSWPCSGGRAHPGQRACSTGLGPTPPCRGQSLCWSLWARWEPEGWRGLKARGCSDTENYRMQAEMHTSELMLSSVALLVRLMLGCRDDVDV